MTDLKEKYNKEIVSFLKEKRGYKNTYSVAKIEKIVVNTGLGKIVNARKGKETHDKDSDVVKDIVSDFALIAGQAPHLIRARKSISGFNLRAGMISGARVTLRGEKMYDFLSRLVNIAFPRSRDFRGLRKSSVDESGNMTIGIPEHIIFPEVPHDKIRQMWGMEVAIVTTAKNREEGVELLKALGMPLRDKV